MKARDLRVTFLLAAAWLVGLTMYSMMKAPTLGGEEGAAPSLMAPRPMGATALSDEAAKHSKLPTHWAHQRWGAV